MQLTTLGISISLLNDDQCMLKDSTILGYWYPSNVKVAYILILGVKKQYRRIGIGIVFFSQLQVDKLTILLNTIVSSIPLNLSQKGKKIFCNTTVSNQYHFIQATNKIHDLFLAKMLYYKKLLNMHYARNSRYCIN